MEIKYRGPLNKNQLKKLVGYLNYHGKEIISDYEKTVYFDTSMYPEIGDFATGMSRISLKSDRKGVVLRIKKGDPAEPKREEINVSLNNKDCLNLLYIFNCLGLKYGYYRPAFRRVFRLNNAVFSIKTRCAMGNHFEIELKNEIQIEEMAITSLLKKLRLSLWSKDQYQRRINNNIKKFPAINIYESTLF